MPIFWKAVRTLASLRLTVGLFAAAMFLIFAGTLAQANRGIWDVTEDYFRSFFVWIDLQVFVPKSVAELPGRLPYPGGFTIGGLLMLNLVLAYTARFRWSARRLWIYVLHTGIVLLLVSEMVTAFFAREGNMSIDEGESANYAEDVREVELAVVDQSDPDHDGVVVVPESVLKTATGTIRDPLLPFEVVVRQWMANSVVYGPAMAPPGLSPEATAGIGRRVVAEEAAPVSGVEEQTVNAPTAYLDLTHEGESLGTWLVSLYLDRPQTVVVGGRAYQVALRFKRDYKPYTIHLIDFRHEKFTGTEKPRHFSSLIRLVDPEQNEDRRFLISMNHPLRYGGETFFQSAFKEGDVGTVLQVVKNPGWLLPYIACVVVSVGMIGHFGAHLYRFLKQQGGLN